MNTTKLLFDKGAAQVWWAHTTAESAEALLQQMGASLRIPDEYRHAQARKQYALSRLLLQRAAADLGSEIRRSEGAAAYWAYFGGYCALSHSGDVAAVLAAPQPCGIDLQADSRKCWQAARRFLHAQEYDFWLSAVEGDEAQQIGIATALWAAKEAVFKAWGKQGVHFAEEIRLCSGDSADALPASALPTRAIAQRNEQQASFRLEYARIEGNYWLCAALS